MKYITSLITINLIIATSTVLGKEEEKMTDNISIMQVFSKATLENDCVVSSKENVISALYEHLKKSAQLGEVTIPADDENTELVFGIDYLLLGWDFEVKKKKWFFKKGSYYLDCLMEVAKENKVKVLKRSWGLMLLKEQKGNKLLLKSVPKGMLTQVHNDLFYSGALVSVATWEDVEKISLKKFTDLLNEDYARKKSVVGDGWIQMAYTYRGVKRKETIKPLSTCGVWSAIRIMEFYSINQGIQWSIAEWNNKTKSFVILVEK